MRRLTLLLLTTLLSAQAEVEITAEPHHHQILANAQVRVFSVDLPPHTDTLMHWHRHDYIYVTLGDSEVVNAVKGKAPVTVTLRDGQTALLTAPYAHLAHNHSDKPFRNVTIELLHDDQLRHSTHQWDESRGLDILPGGTREILFVKDNVRVSEFELQQPQGEAIISSGPYLLVALTDLELTQMEHNAVVHASASIALKRGEAQWIASPHRHTLLRRGPPVKFITLEFP